MPLIVLRLPMTIRVPLDDAGSRKLRSPHALHTVAELWLVDNEVSL